MFNNPLANTIEERINNAIALYELEAIEDVITDNIELLSEDDSNTLYDNCIIRMNELLDNH